MMAVPLRGTPALKRFECIAPCMGMQARIVMFAADQRQAKTAGDAAIAEMTRLDQILSDYRDDSETAAVNWAAAGAPIAVSRDFLEVLSASLEVSRRSEGAFDVTIGPVTQLWRAARRDGSSPDEVEIASAHALVDWRMVEVDRAAGTVRLAKSGMRLDFGGIGKGFAADRAFQTLQAHGITTAFVAISGDIRLGDAPPGSKGWRISVADGISESSTSSVYELINCGISTSGDAEQFIVVDGERRSHILNPREGLGLTGRSAVTVIAPNDTIADALATALSVLPPADGVRLVESIDGASARIVHLSDGRPIITVSSRFPAPQP